MLFIMGIAFPNGINAQSWQQEVKYKIDVKLTPPTELITGSETITYINHSPDTLDRVFFHLYWNAFQPNSMMDVRSRTIADPDPRVLDRIQKLREAEQGFMTVSRLQQDGINCQISEEGTILEVSLSNPIPPNTQVEFDLDFMAQVPIQIRRSGRDNAEGIEYSMSQWYPKSALMTQMVGMQIHTSAANFTGPLEVSM